MSWNRKSRQVPTSEPKAVSPKKAAPDSRSSCGLHLTKVASVDNANRHVSGEELFALLMHPRRSYVVKVCESQVLAPEGDSGSILALLFKILDSGPWPYGGSQGCTIEAFFYIN